MENGIPRQEDLSRERKLDARGDLERLVAASDRLTAEASDVLEYQPVPTEEEHPS